jgi:pimeloyl-ACP methyl ester carboxylesterase
MLRKIILAILVLFIAAAAVIWGVTSYLMGRFREPWPGNKPPAGIEEVRFTTSDGVGIAGWWWPGRDPQKGIILSHGIRANRLAMLPRAEWLHKTGYSVLLFDFRGCGESGGEGSLGYAERLDVEAAMAFLREKKGVREMALIGQSMGAAADAMAADHWDGVKGAVLEHLYNRLEVAVRARVRSRAGWLEPVLSPLLLWQVRPRLGFAPEQLAPVLAIRKARCPILLAFGGKDRTIPSEAAGELFAAAPQLSTLWLKEAAGHQDLYRFDPKSYEAKIGGFLKDTLGPPEGEKKR